jgi:hypothetical protein
MIVWKLATRPATATSASARVPRPPPKIVFRLSKSGSSERPRASAPGAMPADSTSVAKATSAPGMPSGLR